MTSAEKQTFLADLHVGVMSLNDPDSGPLTVPIWYDYTPGGDLWVITGRESRKGKLLSEGTRVSLAAQTEDAPYRYVSVEGPVTGIAPTQADTLLSMAIRYLGDAQGTAYAEASPLDGQITVRIQPERWLAVDYSKMS
jgi:PPOX class probable F420-dependent enzyme